MTDNSLNISIPLKFDIKTPPCGMTDYDPKALSPEQQKELNVNKLFINKGNLIYFAEHPEVKAIVALIIRMTMVRRPRNIIDFIAQIFTRPEHEIRKQVHKILKERPIECEVIPFCEHQHWDY